MEHIRILDLTNPKGRVFFTSDLHGHYDLLHDKLREVAFDSTKDVLICGGDWCDKGPDSQYVLDYLNEPWVYSIRANHEQLLIQTVEEGFSGPAARCLYENGGEWFFDMLDQGQMSTIKAIYESFKSLPLAIELLTPTEKIGIVHAQVPSGCWDKFKKMTKSELEWNGEATAQWARTNYDKKLSIQVGGVDRVLVGHTPTDSGEIEVLGNVHYCDLGSFFRDKISFVQLV